jgi:hypothetical protein
MTLAEISNTVPNGFHDAELLELNISYVQRQITLRFGLFVGLPVLPTREERERVALVTVLVQDFQFCIIEPPTGALVLDEHDLSTVDDRQYEQDNASLPKLAEGMFRFSFYAFNWTASIHLAAKSASMAFDDLEDAKYVQQIMAGSSRS